jgi:hypothetical protein
MFRLGVLPGLRYRRQRWNHPNSVCEAEDQAGVVTTTSSCRGTWSGAVEAGAPADHHVAGDASRRRAGDHAHASHRWLHRRPHRRRHHTPALRPASRHCRGGANLRAVKCCCRARCRGRATACSFWMHGRSSAGTSLKCCANSLRMVSQEYNLPRVLDFAALAALAMRDHATTAVFTRTNGVCAREAPALSGKLRRIPDTRLGTALGSDRHRLSWPKSYLAGISRYRSRATAGAYWCVMVSSLCTAIHLDNLLKIDADPAAATAGMSDPAHHAQEA